MSHEHFEDAKFFVGELGGFARNLKFKACGIKFEGSNFQGGLTFPLVATQN